MFPATVLYFSSRSVQPLSPRLLPFLFHRTNTNTITTTTTLTSAMSSIKRKASTAAGGSNSKKPRPNASITSFFGAPTAAPPTKSAPASSSNAAQAAGTSKFHKAAWVALLADEQRSLLQLEIDTLDESWLAELKDEIVTKEFLDLKRFLDREASAGKKIFPPREDIYSWYGPTATHCSVFVSFLTHFQV